jgi:hypothetical protein
VVHSTQKQEAPSKLACGRRMTAVCVCCSLVRHAIAGGRGGAGRWRLVGLITARLVWWGSTSDAGHQEGGDDEALWNRWQCSGSGSHWRQLGWEKVVGAWMMASGSLSGWKATASGLLPVLNRRFPIKFEFLGS